MKRSALLTAIGIIAISGLARAGDSTYREERTVTSPAGTTSTTTEQTRDGVSKTTQQQTTTDPATGDRLTRTSTTYTVKSYEPGRSVTLISPDGTVSSYAITPESTIPTDVSAGRKVTIENAPGTAPTLKTMRYYTETTTTHTSE